MQGFLEQLVVYLVKKLIHKTCLICSLAEEAGLLFQAQVIFLPCINGILTTLLDPFVASFGGPQIRVHHFDGLGRRSGSNRHQGQAGLGTFGISTLIQLLPFIIVVFFSILSSFAGFFNSAFSFFGSGMPSYSLTPSPPFTEARYTYYHHIPYFVDPLKVSSLSQVKLSRLDKKVEVNYINALRVNCEYEIEERKRRMEQAYGFFRVDKEAYEKAKNMVQVSCNRLRELGIR